MSATEQGSQRRTDWIRIDAAIVGRIEDQREKETIEQRRRKAAGVRDPSGGFTEFRHVVPGEVITDQADYMRGHGTFEIDGKLIATLSGVVEKINKLVSVRPLRARYTAEIGDVVVGRILDVGARRWKVDVN